MINFGPVPANSVLPILWTSHDAATGANETMSGLALADIIIYKGVSLTQRSSTSGFAFFGGDADGLDLDTFTGVNGVSIDLGDNTDAGFYAVGSLFTVVLGPVTIDAQTVYTVLGTFRLVAAEAIAGKPKADVDGWLGTAAATPTVAGVPEVDVTHVAGSTTSVSTLASSVATLLADIGGVATAAADGDPTSTDLLFAYIKQLINILVGSAGVVTFPAAAAPGNAVSLAEIIRAIYDDTNALPDSRALTTVQSDLDNIQTRLPAALVGGRMDSDVAVIQAAVITAAAIAPDAIGASELAADAVAEIADAVWDELLTGHTTLATFGQVMNAHGARTGEINDAGATTTVFIVYGFTEATDNHFIGDIIVFTSGALIGQARRITAYTGGTQTITVPPALPAAPANNDDFVIIPFARVDLGHINNVAQTATLDDIEAQTDDIGVAGAGLTAIPWNAAWDAEVESEVDDALGAGTGTALTAIPWNAAWDAEVQSEVDDALIAQRLDELINADSDIDGLAPPTVGSVVHELLTKTAGSFTYDQTTDSLEAIRDKETDIETDTAEIGAAGAGLTNINLPDQTMNITGNITGNLSGSVGSVTGAVGSVTGAVGSVAGNVDGNVTGTIGGLTAAALKDFFDTDSATTYA